MRYADLNFRASPNGGLSVVRFISSIKRFVKKSTCLTKTLCSIEFYSVCLDTFSQNGVTYTDTKTDGLLLLCVCAHRIITIVVHVMHA